MATYVLVGGAWLGGWVWRDVARQLRVDGHEVHAATLTGMGERVHLARPEVDLDTHITDVVNLMDFNDLAAVVLVGHSYSGIVVEGAADCRPDRVDTVVYVDSAPLGDGAAHIDFYPPDARAAVDAAVAEAGDGWKMPFPGIEQLGQMASIDGLDDDALALLASHATAQPIATYTQPLKLTGDGGGLRKRAIACSRGDFSAAQIREALASDDPGMFGVFAGPGWDFDDIPTGHWPMLSTPRELADLLAAYGDTTD